MTTSPLHLHRVKYVAATVFLMKVLVFGLIGYHLYVTSDVVVIGSFRALKVRTGEWLVLFLSLA